MNAIAQYGEIIPPSRFFVKNFSKKQEYLYKKLMRDFRRRSSREAKCQITGGFPTGIFSQQAADILTLLYNLTYKKKIRTQYP
ncbi:MAG: hypothetical protein MJ082_02045 [Clostridia bacterium]|nr:hypothetical protein [Clostridia bacterium]